jgi:hypothetical protein
MKTTFSATIAPNARSRRTWPYPPATTWSAGAGSGVGDEGQHGDHREVGRDVEEEEDGEARRIRGRCDQPAHEPAEADAGVDGDPLERERGVSFPVRRQPGEEHGRRRPEEAGTEAQHGRERERLPGPVDEREQPVADRRDGERGGDRRAMSRAVRRSTLRS